MEHENHAAEWGMLGALGLVIVVLIVAMSLFFAFEPGQPDPTSTRKPTITRDISKQTPAISTPTLPPTSTPVAESTPVVITVVVTATPTPTMTPRPTRIDSTAIPTEVGIIYRKYKISPGDTLWDISRAYYGTGTKWPTIWHDNLVEIGDNPHLIYPNTLIKIRMEVTP